MNTTTVLLLSLLGAPPEPSASPCSGRDPCRLVETLDAGQDARGRALKVTRLSLGWTDLESGASGSGRMFGPGERQATATPGHCEATEWWLSRPDKPAQLLLSVCSDFQGAVRKQEVKVGPNWLRYTRSGVRRQDRWSTTRTLQLSPLRWLGESERTSWDSSASGEEKTNATAWEVEPLRGEIERAAVDCPPGIASLGERRLPYLPQVRTDRAYLEGGWRTASLGSEHGGCALEARSVLLGRELLGGPEDLSLRALLVAEDTLLVEVQDDTWTGPSDKWLQDDHLELWLAPLPPQVLNGCAGKLEKDQKPVQWGIRVTDGRVFPAYGLPKTKLQVERVQLPGGKGYRLKLTLPLPFLGISVVYSDSDGGRKQESMVATSPLVFGRTETLNPVYKVPDTQAVCRVQEGVLSPVPGPEIEPQPGLAVFQVGR